ncbi:pyridoxamine 5'-phosphate oxidase family protein [Sulfitobacter aestuariivivens]|uniref:Pyridoxamine 5'-phosphate oxidase family protein n=1 Tax=Sulfitobacter aestuariivivens TaxID=2766981 RepID=A0A927HEP5_9RHOB|nr:pyridoxamine 5'-phosphate oxidase family protein [Sulfitobacter aestuariivivens]MBD3663593.1 pyridoxamine 5'-phosphate oxidase family protein [Sulfitobacter aestuariivivens]
MAKQFDTLSDAHQAFIGDQQIFFCATAADEGRVNVSPKDMASLRILGPNRIIWRNLTGSGNETAAHLARINRMTLMWCSFTTRPLILRIYGKARTLHAKDADFAALNATFPETFAARQIYDLTLDMVQTSCGYNVPFFEHQGPRDTLEKWAENKGPDGIKTYWKERNQHSIDGLPTNLPGPDDA